MLFGKKTGNADNVRKTIADGNDATEPVADKTAAPEDGTGKEPTKRKGHGRNGFDAYPNASVVEIGVPDLHAGDICPECLVGTVYPSPPKIVVKVVGQAPLTATVYKLARVRCRLCDKIFSAKLPDGVSPSNTIMAVRRCWQCCVMLRLAPA